MTDDEIIAVVQAHKEGKRIEWSKRGSNGPWYGFDRPVHDDWDFTRSEYRVAPEPRKPREWWLIPDKSAPIYKQPCFIGHSMSQVDYEHEQIHVREVIE